MPSAKKPPQGGQTIRVHLHKLHEGQKRVDEHPARYKVILCGRRWGKTASSIRWLSDGALAGLRCGMFLPSYKLLGDAWRELVDRLGPVISTKNEQDKRIELVTSGIIEAWSLDDPDAGRSRKYHRVVIDEAGLQSDLMARWAQAIRPTLADYRGEARFYGTPKGRRSGFVSLYNRGLDPAETEWASFTAPTIENPYIDPEEIAAAKRDMTPEEYEQEFMAIPMDSGTNPFGLDAINKALGDLSTEKPVVYGADLARALDYTVMIGLDPWCRVCRVDRWQSPWATTKTRIASMCKPDGDLIPVVADATGVGDAIVSDLSLMGVLVTPYVFTQPSKTRLMQRLITAFQSGTLTIPSGVEFQWLRNELESFEYEFTATGVKYEAPPGLHDDGVMALGLALHGWDRVQGAPPEAPPGLRQMGDDPYLARESEQVAVPAQPGDFSTQLPSGGW